VAQHILRKELKKDEIREKFVHGFESVASHQRVLWSLAAAALLVALGIFGWRSYSQRQTARAAAAFDDALKVYQTPIRAPGEPAEFGTTSYIDEKNKYTDAERKFLEVAAQYGRTRPGRMALYYAALCEVQLKLYGPAEQNLGKLESSGDESLAGLAKFQMAGIYDQTGKGQQAVELYKELADKPTLFVPKGVVLLALADHYSKTDPAEASKLYNQVKQDFPDSPAAEQADQGLQMLNAKT
jgi:predicted negative regulator of RcsB-dependent stress response